MSEQQANNTNIVGEPLSLEDLLELMGLDDEMIDDEDIESALDWWNVHATAPWVGSLEAPFYEG